MGISLITIATHNTPGDFAWGCFLFVTASVVIAFGWISTARRNRALRDEAKKNGWTWLGENFPEDLPVRDLLGRTDRPISVRNVFTGTQNGIEFAALDCIVGEGRYKSRLSMVAARSFSNPFGAERFNSNLQADHAGEWIAIRRAIQSVSVHSPRYFLLSASEILSLVQSIG